MLKIKNIGGERAGKGNYWNFSTGERINIKTEAILPGDSKVTYYRLSPILILIAGPFLGLVYAAFLPFIGIAMLIKIVMERLFGGVLSKAVKIATFRWSPSAAYFTGKKGAHREEGGDTEGEDDKSEK